MIDLIYSGNEKYFSQNQLERTLLFMENIQENIKNKNIPGAEFTGWMDLPLSKEDLVNRIIKKSKEISEKIDVMIVVGIGGSYLGAKAAVDFLKLSDNSNPEIIFAGYNISSDSISDILKYIENKNFAINIISKSGTTLEPNLALRVLLDALTKKVGKKNRRQYIIATTDSEKGILKKNSNFEDWSSFIIPDNVGGRFSVLTPVGLFPLAVGGADIKKILEGARIQKNICENKPLFENNSVLYSAIRYNLYLQNYFIELFVNWTEKTSSIGLWWQQLFGESEGKNSRGIFPTNAYYTRDLHSIGQYLQDGRSEIFETFLWIKNGISFKVPKNDINDNLEYLLQRDYQWINFQAKEGTKKAHQEGKRPVIEILIDNISEESLGALFYFFQYSVTLGACLLNVNTFDQPGVEAYKKAMLNLLNK